MCAECGVNNLTTQELKIVELRCHDGLNQREIAEELSITEGAVSNYFNSIYQKIGVGGREVTIEEKRHVAEIYYWWHYYRERGRLRDGAITQIETSAIEEPEVKDAELVSEPNPTNSSNRKAKIVAATAGIVGLLIVGILLVWYFFVRQSDPITIQPKYFIIQSSSPEGPPDEFFLDLQQVQIPAPTENGGIDYDLRRYSLELTFEGDERQVQLWYKNPTWGNVYSKNFIITSGEPICFNPFTDSRATDDFDDFSNIRAIGAKLIPNAEGVQIISARLVPSC